MFIVLELQTNTDGTVGTLVNAYENRNQAENKYHTILAYAATSNLPCHAASMFTNEGNMIKSERYLHPQQEEEPEQQEEE